MAGSLIVRRLLLVGLALSAASLVGCVRRRLTIRSNPPGALVYVDNHEIGTTPCSTEFLYYGTREIRLVKNGFETLTVRQPIPTPWYQIPGIDFFSENVVPGDIRDERALAYDLVPQVIVPAENLLSRAEGLRQGSRAEGPIIPTPVGPLATPAPAAEPLGGPPPNRVPAETLPTPSPAGPRVETLPPGGSPPIYAPPLP